jgi:hypothetical protein
MALHSSGSDARKDLLHGTLDMLILRTLQWGPQHGYAIGQTIRAQSWDVLQIVAGSRPAVRSHRSDRDPQKGLGGVTARKSLPTRVRIAIAPRSLVAP